MRNRREFLQIGLASSALPLIAGEQREPSFHGRVSREPLHEVIVEMSSPLALAFRAAAVELGLDANGIHDDISDLWYHKLDRQWRSTTTTLAGITLSTSLFCLETFARDYGMHVWFRALHNRTANGQAERVMSGDERLVEQAAVLEGEWADAFARFATAVPLSMPGKFQQKIVETVALQSDEPNHMVSWIIAPQLRNQSDVVS
jgi:hypothetical protein